MTRTVLDTNKWSQIRVQDWLNKRMGPLMSPYRRIPRPETSTGRLQLSERIAEHYSLVQVDRVPPSAINWWYRNFGQSTKPQEEFYASWLDTAAERRERAIKARQEVG